jgi:DNA-binding LacI/PurR family transcriptional regulator
MADVAKLAGVSPQTVSRVSNKKSNVNAATRDKVLKAMKTLDYRPNSAARALKYGRFKAIGVIMFDLSDYGNTRTLDAIALAAASAGYSLTLIPLAEPTASGLERAFEQLREAVVDGIILVADARLLAQARIEPPTHTPLVVANTAPTDEYVVVDTDQWRGAAEATRHLLNMGHKTVHLILGPHQSHSSNNRRDAWRRALEEAGAPVPEIVQGDWSTQSGYLAGQELADNPEVTAVFALNDQMALGALRAFHERGIKVPGDISIVGFDDIEEAHSFWPPLTTVRQDFGKVGETCMKLLLLAIDGQDAGVKSTLVQPELIVRGSSGPVRSTTRLKP